MKICIPTEDDQKLVARAFGHFGSAPFFTIVDTETGDLRVSCATPRANASTAHATIFR